MSSPRDISSFALKIIAIIGMTGNHAAYVLGPHLPTGVTVFLFSLGGLTFPIMAFLLAEGYHYTSNFRRYLTRLLIFALISQAPYSLLWGAAGNVLITLALGLAAVYAIDKFASTALKVLSVCACVALSASCDWGIIGPLLVCLFHVKRGEGASGVAICMALPLAVLGLPALSYLAALAVGQELSFAPAATASMIQAMAQVGLPTIGGLFLIGDAMLLLPSPVVAAGEAGYALGGVTLAGLLITLYRGCRGKPLKWFFYLYYPLHLSILWVAGVILYG